MMVAQTALPGSEKALEKPEVCDISKEQLALTPQLLASLGQSAHGLSLGPMNPVSSACLPMGYPLDLASGLPPALQAQLLMGRSPLLNPFSSFPMSSSLMGPLASGIQALKGDVPTQTHAPAPCGRPNATEINDVLATLAAASTKSASPVPTNATSSSKSQPSLPVVVFMDCDEESLSEYQCQLRKQIELFEASSQDVQWNAQGRNKPIVLGQVGIRCRWCANLPTWSRSRGAVYYSATLDGLYQAAQNMAKNHICKNCRYIPANVRQDLSNLREGKRRAAGGKKYWAEGAKVLGIYQCEDGLRFKHSKVPVPPSTTTQCIAIEKSSV